MVPYIDPKRLDKEKEEDQGYIMSFKREIWNGMEIMDQYLTIDNDLSSYNCFPIQLKMISNDKYMIYQIV